MLLARWDDGPMAWAPISHDERDGLNVALNEATWAAIDVDLAGRRARLMFDVLSLPPDGPASADSHVIVAVNLVSRIAASLRMGWWDDEAAQIVPLEVADLDATVRSFGSCAIYGWKFIDPPEESWRHWRGWRAWTSASINTSRPTSLTCSSTAAPPGPGTWTCASGSRRSRSAPSMAATSPCPSSSLRESAGGMACTPAIPVPAARA